MWADSQQAPDLNDILRAQQRLHGRIGDTPLLESAALNMRLGGRLLVKPESLQRTGSFKIRGALNKIARLAETRQLDGVLAYSSGNHAQGVAEAARLYGVAALILMPSDAPSVKVARTRRSGAEVQFYDRQRDNRVALLAEIQRRTGWVEIPPYSDFDVIAGQGTLGLEILQQAHRRQLQPDLVLVPCGGGGLASGLTLALRGSESTADVAIVEPDSFDDAGQSLRAGKYQGNAAGAASICDGLQSELSPLTFSILQRGVKLSLTVSDNEVLDAMRIGFEEFKLVIEPSGAVALAAVLSGKIALENRTVVAVVTGGNADANLIQRALHASC